MDAAFQADTYGVLELNIPGAHVRLRPQTDGNRIHVRGAVPDADPDHAHEVFDQKGISTHQGSDRLHIYGDRPSTTVEDWRWRYAHDTTVHLEIHLPPTLDVTAQTPGGSISAAGLAGTLEFVVSGGSMHAEQLNGSLDVRGSGGTATVRGCSGSSLDLQWTAGAVTLEEISGATTTLRTTSAPTSVHALRGPTDLSVRGAPLTLRNLEGPCEAEVRGGTLTFEGAPTQDTFLRSVGASLQASLPATTSASVSFTGTKATLDERFEFEGTRTPTRVVGTLNGGGPMLHAHAVEGTARCSVRNDP